MHLSDGSSPLLDHFLLVLLQLTPYERGLIVCAGLAGLKEAVIVLRHLQLLVAIVDIGVVRSTLVLRWLALLLLTCQSSLQWRAVPVDHVLRGHLRSYRGAKLLINAGLRTVEGLVEAGLSQRVDLLVVGL